MSSVEIRAIPLARSQAEEAGEVLTRAFWDDPMSVWLLPDDEHRNSALGELFGAGTRLVLNEGLCWTTPGKLDGAALWMPPGKHDITEEMMVAAGLEQMAAAFGDDAMGRFGTLMAHMADQHEKNMQGKPHWYLLLLGVEPERQGIGLGSDLVRPMVARADQEGRACYLETMKPTNLPFYQKHGFEVVSEFDTPDGGLHTWCMRREPAKP